MDLGAGRRGVDMGPSALRLAGLNEKLAALGYAIEDLGNIAIDQPETTPVGPANARYLLPIAHTCTRLAEMVEKAANEGKVPLVLGGDHSVAIGTVSGMAAHFRKRSRLAGQDQNHEKLGLIWIDAHADMNTPESSPSGNVHGMPLACIAGLGPAELTGIGGFAPKVDPASISIVGLRSVDDIERDNVRRHWRARVHHARHRRARAAQRDAGSDRARYPQHGGVSFSFDMDVVDPQEAPGVGTPVRGGITYREAHLAMEILCDSGRMASMEMVEVNPVIDEVNRTALLAVELIMSALGKRIL